MLPTELEEVISVTSAIVPEVALERGRHRRRHRLRARARPWTPGPGSSAGRPAGSGDTGSLTKAAAPARTIPAVKRVVATGLRMKGSEKFMSPPPPPGPSPRPRLPEARRDPVKHEVDDRRREEREHLADDQAADDRDAERVAELGAHAGAEHERNGAEERGHGRHEDRPEPQQARLVDRLARRRGPRCARRPARSRSS